MTDADLKQEVEDGWRIYAAGLRFPVGGVFFDSWVELDCCWTGLVYHPDVPMDGLVLLKYVRRYFRGSIEITMAG